jgi:RNA polymerase sigma-70 factor, ECF subfamily
MELRGRETGAEDWLRRLRDGREDPEKIYAEIFRAYYVRIRRLLEQRGVSRNDAEDLAQETFLRVCKNLEGFRGEASFSSWVFSVALNVERERHRRGSTLKRSGKEVPLDSEEATEAVASLGREFSLPQTIPQPQEELLTKEMYERATRALQDLPEQMRRCFILRFHQELKYKEIASVMQISIQTVKSHLHQARERLKATLAGG